MLGSSVLDTAIGMISIYLFLSLVCSGVNEGIASLLNKRGKNLFEGIKNLLNDPNFIGLAQQVYGHGLVDGISKQAANPNKPNRLPSYMPSKVFATALLDIMASQGIKDSWRAAVERRQSELASAKAAANPAAASKEIEKMRKNLWRKPRAI